MGPSGAKTLCNACGSRYRAGHTRMPEKDADGQFICSECRRAFSTIGALGGHRRFCDGGSWRCGWCQCKNDECSGKVSDRVWRLWWRPCARSVTMRPRAFRRRLRSAACRDRGPRAPRHSAPLVAAVSRMATRVLREKTPTGSTCAMHVHACSILLGPSEGTSAFAMQARGDATGASANMATARGRCAPARNPRIRR